MNNVNYVLEAINITKRFPGDLANDKICLNVKAGEVLGLIGENGAFFVAGQVQENTGFAAPELIVTVEIHRQVGTGVGAYQIHIAIVIFVPDLGVGLSLHQRDIGCSDGQGGAAPPILPSLPRP